MGYEKPDVRLSSAQLRALAHPLRSRLLAQLRLHGPATATDLAAELETNTGATSYHLRKLAEVGMVVETGAGQGRQRFWKAAHQTHGFSYNDFSDDPDDRAAVHWLTRHYLYAFTERVEHWMATLDQWSPQWRDAVTSNDFGLTLTPERLREFNDEVMRVAERYRAETPADQEGAELVLVHLYEIPVRTRGQQP